jgi:hypothetical protein
MTKIVRVDKAKRGKRKSDAQRRDRDAIVPIASPPPESSSRSPKTNNPSPREGEEEVEMTEQKTKAS